MGALKSYTDFEQSKRLAEILPFGSEDGALTENYHCIPCWSLAALLSVLPKEVRLVGSTKDHYWYCECIDAHDSNWYAGFESSDNPVDACVKLLLRLHKQNLL